MSHLKRRRQRKRRSRGRRKRLSRRRNLLITLRKMRVVRVRRIVRRTKRKKRRLPFLLLMDSSYKDLQRKEELVYPISLLLLKAVLSLVERKIRRALLL